MKVFLSPSVFTVSDWNDCEWRNLFTIPTSIFQVTDNEDINTQAALPDKKSFCQVFVPVCPRQPWLDM